MQNQPELQRLRTHLVPVKLNLIGGINNLHYDLVRFQEPDFLA